MDPQLSTALSLLVTGMITVFVVLLLVVLTGNTLIRLVNLWAADGSGSAQDIDLKKVAAINAAVEMVTEGRGRVTKIERKKSN